MAETAHDNNTIATAMGVLNTDGVTPTRIKASVGHVLDVSDDTTGSDAGLDVIDRDNSGYTVLAASDANGNIINLYVNSSGQLLIDSN